MRKVLTLRKPWATRRGEPTLLLVILVGGLATWQRNVNLVLLVFDGAPVSMVLGEHFHQHIASLQLQVHVIVAIESLFFALGGIRDNLFNGRVVMPDEEYLQSWFYDTKLGESENHSDRMDTIGKCWGTFIATIALLKMATALSGGTQRLGKILAVIFIATNM